MPKNHTLQPSPAAATRSCFPVSTSWWTAEIGNGYMVTLCYEEQMTSGGVKELRDYIEIHPGSRTLDFTTVFGVSKRTVERWLKQFKDDNKIEFRGAPKTGGYFLKLSK